MRRYLVPLSLIFLACFTCWNAPINDFLDLPPPEEDLDWERLRKRYGQVDSFTSGDGPGARVKRFNPDLRGLIIYDLPLLGRGENLTARVTLGQSETRDQRLNGIVLQLSSAAVIAGVKAYRNLTQK